MTAAREFFRDLFVTLTGRMTMGCMSPGSGSHIDGPPYFLGPDGIHPVGTPYCILHGYAMNTLPTTRTNTSSSSQRRTSVASDPPEGMRDRKDTVEDVQARILKIADEARAAADRDRRFVEAVRAALKTRREVVPFGPVSIIASIIAVHSIQEAEDRFYGDTPCMAAKE